MVLLKQKCFALRDFLSKNIDRKTAARCLTILLFFFGIFLINRYFLKRLVPISQLLSEINSSQYRKLILGKYYVLAYYKQPAKGTPSYSIATTRKIKSKNIFDTA